MTTITPIILNLTLYHHLKASVLNLAKTIYMLVSKTLYFLALVLAVLVNLFFFTLLVVLLDVPSYVCNYFWPADFGVNRSRERFKHHQDDEVRWCDGSCRVRGRRLCPTDDISEFELEGNGVEGWQEGEDEGEEMVERNVGEWVCGVVGGVEKVE